MTVQVTGDVGWGPAWRKNRFHQAHAFAGRSVALRTVPWGHRQCSRFSGVSRTNARAWLEESLCPSANLAVELDS
jgi:hypothetical protein